MTKIHELPELLANQIAAGEVIERPASVVKELVENAIDANATQVEIVIENSGLDLIKVIDNGQGIDQAEVPLAFVRHATSKIQDRHDLFNIMTLGFRGEALPSIAAVADVTLQTRTKLADTGFLYQVKGGQVAQEGPTVGRFGTIVAVRSLFYNTPARLKYLKKPQTELSLMVETINHLAMAYPNVALTLSHNGKTLVKTPGNGDLRQVLAVVYDRKTAEKMVAFEGASGHFKVNGYLSLPEQTRSSRSYFAVLVNHRFVKNFSVSNAISAGYGSKLMVGRFPIGAINIELDPLLVDVNVHPQKAEIRLSEEGELTELITQVIANRLRGENLIPAALDNLGQGEKEENPTAAIEEPSVFVKNPATEVLSVPVKADRVVEIHDKGQLADAPVANFASRYAKEEYQPIFMEENQSQPKIAEPLAAYQPDTSIDQSTSAAKENGGLYNHVDTGLAALASQAMVLGVEQSTQPEDSQTKQQQNDWLSGQQHQDQTKVATPKPVNQDLDLSDQASKKTGFPNLDYIGQMHGTFLFAQDQDHLYLVDQHAAQERLNYEYYRQVVGQVGEDQQQLLAPITLTYSTADMLKIADFHEIFEQVGLHLEEFGPNTIALYEHPAWILADQAEGTIEEMIDWVLHDGKLTVAAFREKAAIMMSCKRAIKANWHISDEEAKTLLRDLAQAENPYNCPHGRPVLTSFTIKEMERMFKRIQDSHESWQTYDTHPF
ncbi:DNA mismatch repair endonuclease MutL [Fructobacillus americanaquae]|uniref:DNA mismatch repair protein MutL n=1 Tax=Fructobacillus americanaquae TaxID=2940302 RepID=A0ABY5C1G4_9LACO|nr:DNA mismatch repair endonuclease MutL [Fructobacillus americanaquae]USS91919.1 DNA mismatch repair endonuclease MutL [Fructobacillus americanaquae]